MAQKSDSPAHDFFDGKYARFIILCIFLATTFIFFGDVLFGKKFLWDDVAEYIYPFTTFAARSTAAGEIPFWNPFTFSGMPFAADFQTQYFYPPHTLLFLFLKSDNTLPVKVIEWVILLHFVVAQWGMYRFCRSREMSGWGALIAAVSYGFCGSLAVRTIHPMVVYHLAYFPLILMNFHAAVFQRRWKNVIITGILLGLAIISGHPQTSAYILLFLAGYGVWHIAAALRTKDLTGMATGGALLRAALPVVIAAGLTAIQFFPAQELAGLSERSEITYEKAADGSMQPKQWLTAVVPNLFGAVFPGNSKMQFALPTPDHTAEQPKFEQTHFYWDTAFYFGIVALIFGVYGAARRWNTPFGGYLLAMCGFALLYGLGKNGFIHELLFGVPVFGSFRNPGRMMFYVSFAFCYFAGAGFDNVARNKKNLRELKIFFLASALPLTVALLAATGMLSGIADVPEVLVKQVDSFGVTAFVLALTVVATGFLLHRGTFAPAVAGIILVSAAFIDQTIAYSPFSKGTTNPAEMYRIAPEMKNAFRAGDPNNLFRVAMRNNYGMAMQRNQGPLDSIMLYEGYNPILLMRRSPLTSTPEESSDLLNIRYMLQLNPASQQNEFIERPSAMPRARMVYDALIVAPENVQKTMEKGSIDYRRTVVIEKQPGVQLPKLQPDEVQHNIECIRYANNDLTYRITTGKPGVLCLSEIWYPAWKAAVDGVETEVLRSNYSLRAVAVPAGTHTVALHYDSNTFSVGRWTTILTLAVVVAGLFWTRRRQNRP